MQTYYSFLRAIELNNPKHNDYYAYLNRVFINIFKMFEPNCKNYSK